MLNIFINPITQSFISITGLLLSHNMVLIIYLSTIHYMLYTLCIWSPYTGWRQAFLVIYRLIYTFELAMLDLNNLYVSRYTLYSTQSTHGDIRAYWLRPGEIMRDIRQPVWVRWTGVREIHPAFSLAVYKRTFQCMKANYPYAINDKEPTRSKKYP